MLSARQWGTAAVIRLCLGIFATFCLGIVLVGLSTHFAPGLAPENKKLLHMVIVTLAFQGAALFWLWAFFQEHDLGLPAALGADAPGAPRAFLAGIFVGFLVLPAAWLLQLLSANVMEGLGIELVRQEAVVRLAGGIPPAHQIYLGIMTIVIAPVVEESLFRGVFYPWIKEHGHPVAAFLGTALLFAAIHANMLSFASLFFLAIVLTVLYECTDNLLAPIAAHSAFNAVNFAYVISAARSAQTP